MHANSSLSPTIEQLIEKEPEINVISSIKMKFDSIFPGQFLLVATYTPDLAIFMIYDCLSFDLSSSVMIWTRPMV